MSQLNRKNEHVEIAEKFFNKPKQSDYDALAFVHHSFPEMAVNDVDIRTSFLDFHLSSPFYINAMTGGSEKTEKINAQLAQVAAATGVAIASGSQSAALKDPSVTNSFKVLRQYNPTGLIFANLGADHSVENALRAIDMLQANAIQLHVNAPQELIMPEGDRDFHHWLTSIETVVKQVDVPVIVKEVGFGMSRNTLSLLNEIGVETVDLSGRGGTNFAAIENVRRASHSLDFLENWGQSTIVSLLEAQPFLTKMNLLASGGVRNSFDIIKSLSLGAKAVGASGFFLHSILNDGVDSTIQTIENWQEELKLMMTLLGKKTLPELQETDLIISGSVRDWCLAREIDYQQFAKRS
ncbi:type 2 isopentenyl-diphosphate Delta-isomerase [Carnobacterium divergens]|uniref:type 2 isopentenyl-diphosphate Delta-isomerase n=1 Tax=Carnobacterium divergens TaxID=2748 RepID=UPI000D4690B7|nr:type 2 isopentenyl-diphosphate Delta-isomerase [Carnobacterium divergens]MCO6016904.1 type 2 isopentenyl-diphosphate Delta-isomerase [Carnobacterium divergens]TFI62556.1 type 2 isopentenyl-diphosphate Delta-isomerase [Carnobacterium divergens]TFI89758.1 type 2 isopentenyl-diphosphate Delta-isomerase [Carnobacterium divergens]TFJ04813.1 type 2 isopentenyl-diphosphate Delta-isomerase [Carnobacterium divergens]TFJ06303.1 type 2 isopentenyl-diphosphate Delta-isomerase [Carnobacterium divergens]